MVTRRKLRLLLLLVVFCYAKAFLSTTPPTAHHGTHPCRKHVSSPSSTSLQASTILLEQEFNPHEGKRPLVAKLIWDKLLRRSINRRTEHAGLRVSVEARSNRAAMFGRLDTLNIAFDKMMFERLRLTGGCELEIMGLSIRSAGLLLPGRRIRRLLRPCEVYGKYFITQEDLHMSPMIRGLVESVLNKANNYNKPPHLKDERGITISKVCVNDAKLEAAGVYNTSLVPVPFRYRTGIQISRDGHIIYLKDPEILWDSPLPVPLLLMRTLRIDLGNNAQFSHVQIGGGGIMCEGRFVVSPQRPLLVAPVKQRPADVYHDLGETLSQFICGLLRFSRT
ncbi:unnamed protein product [Chrysoparadoxa australica]